MGSDQDPRDVRRRLRRALLIEVLLSDETSRAEAAATLRALGETAVDEAVAALAGRLRQVVSSQGLEVPTLALRDLQSSGPATAVALLVEKLRAGEPDLRSGAAYALIPLGAAAAPAVPALATSLQDTHGHVRKAAAFALGKLGPLSEPAIPALMSACRDGEEPVRRAAEEALSQVLVGQEGAVPLLIQWLDSDDLDLRRRAALALRRVGPEAAAAIPSLTRALAEPNREFAREAAISLGFMGSDALPAAGALVDMMVSGDPSDRLAAGEALRHMAVRARTVPAELIRAADHPNLEVQRFVLTQLKQLGGLAANGPEVGRLLHSPDSGIRLLAALCLAGSPMHSRVAVQELVMALEAVPPVRPPVYRPTEAQRREHEDAVRSLEHAIDEMPRALRLAGPTRADVVLSYGRLVGHASVRVRLRALQELREAKDAASPSLPQITAALGAGESEVRRAAACAMAEIQGDSNLVASSIDTLLTDDDAATRACAVRALGQDSRNVVSRLPDFVRALKDTSAPVRRQAVAALARADEGIGAAIPELQLAAATDPDAVVRGAAAALVKVLSAGRREPACGTP